MKEYQVSNYSEPQRVLYDPSKKEQRRKKSKRRNKQAAIRLYILLCCFAVMMLTINLFSGNSPVVIERPLSAPTADGEIANSTAAAVLPRTDVNTEVDDEAWALILVNRKNPIPDDYEVELTELSNGHSVDTRIYPALQEMFNAARSDGIYPIVASGYRTAQKQQSLLDNKINEYRAMGYSAEEAKEKAESWVAIPGTSEHQIGIAVDINADGIHSAGYEVYGWLEKNAYKYGFILRYTAEKTEITGVIDEPWHYRYVGVEAAIEIYNQGVCLEEYLDSTN